MTNINCTSNCIHQEDGKCKLDNITINVVSLDSDCPYFESRTERAKDEPYTKKSYTMN